MAQIDVDGGVGCMGDSPNAYSAGNQLTLIGTEFSVDEGAGSGLNADLVDGYNYHIRVAETCPEGSSIKEIASDGTVICMTDALIRPGFTKSTIDSSAIYNSITIGSDGLGLISSTDGDTWKIKVTHCDDIACSSGTSTIVSDYGSRPSITVGADGLGLISYTHYDLQVAHCDNIACTSATVSQIDSSSEGFRSSIVIGIDGRGLISYYDLDSESLKVAHCDNTACTSATISTLDSITIRDSGWGENTSITIGDDGLGLISYLEYIDNDTVLKVAHCNNTACTSATISTLDSNPDVGHFSSITIGSDGLGLISYYDRTSHDLKVAHCNNAACTGATIATLESADWTGLYPSITIGSDGLGLISFFDNTNDKLKVVHCSNIICSSASIYALDTGNFEYSTSITIGIDGLGLISYEDDGALKVVHLSNIFGIPYFQRR